MSTYTASSRWSRPLLFPRFVLALVTAIAATYFIVIFYYRLLVEFEISLLDTLLRLSGVNVLQSYWNALIVYGGYNVVTLVLTPDCIGVYSVVVFTLFVLATPRVPRLDRLKEVLVGGLALFLFNIARIWASGFLGARYGLVVFRLFHDYMLGGLMLVAVAMLWVEWLERCFRIARV
ncbi:hypothetical protein ACSU1N_04010 [Thermogladius sp. 4427co]|uniref:hypothetical protein n=1 Tax=Thermogladius sp. 4427co TaxID=3450718 RepID=UPI003F796A4F